MAMVRKRRILSSLFGGAENRRDRSRQPIPVLALLVELFSSYPRERVEPGVAAGIGRRPLGAHPPALLETMEGRVQRALLHLQDVARHLLQPLGDGVAVRRPQ